jgi:hypothetical protein
VLDHSIRGHRLAARGIIHIAERVDPAQRKSSRLDDGQAGDGSGVGQLGVVGEHLIGADPQRDREVYGVVGT